MKKTLFNKALKILLFTNSMILIASAMLGPIYALFVERVGGNLMAASIAGGIVALVAGLTTVISGIYSDKIRQDELIIVIGYLITGFGFILYIFIHSVTALFIVQVIIGLGGGIYAPAFDDVYAKHLDGHKSGLEWGVRESMNNFTTAFGAIAGGFIAMFLGFKVLFLIMALLAFLSAFYIWHLKRNVL